MEKTGEKPIVKIKDLSVIYNAGKPNEVRALDNIDVEIMPQEFVVIFGPSGCGKSTMLYSIAGLQKPTSGKVEVEEKKLEDLSINEITDFHQNYVGMVFQAFHLIPSLSVIDNVCLPRTFCGEKIKEREKRAEELLKRFGIVDQAKKYPSVLSGGQKQRVSIARALVNNPKLILADEPVGNLDSKSAFNVMEILEELNTKDKKTVILVTHNESHLQFADRVIYMKDGKVIKVDLHEKRKYFSSYIFKEDVKETLEKQGMKKEEMVSDELRLLTKSFKGLSPEQIGLLLVPFKARQLFSHVFFNTDEDRMDSARKILTSYLYGQISSEEMKEQLDKDEDRGGIGWDKRIALKFALETKQIFDQAKKIDFTKIQETSLGISSYLEGKYRLKLDKDGLEKLSQLVSDRLKNNIGMPELVKIADIPPKKGGLGVDKRVAQKIGREIEILLLLRYS